MEVDRCQDLQPFQALFVAGLVDSGQALRLQMHLAEGCHSCAAEIARLEAAFHAIPQASSPIEIDQQVLASIVEEVTAEPQERAEPVIVYAATNERRLLWALVLMCLVMVGAVAQWGAGRQSALTEAEQGRHLAQVRTGQAEAGYQRVQGLLDQLTNPRVTTHDLSAGPPGKSSAKARVFVDLGGRSLTIRSVGLGPEVPGVIYAVWWREGDREELVGEIDPVIVARASVARFQLPAWAALPATLLLSMESSQRKPDAARAGKLVLEGALIAGTSAASPVDLRPNSD